MKLLFNILGFISYGVVAYCMLHDPTMYNSPFRMVGGDAYNIGYAFQAATTWAAIGAGFFAAGSGYKPNPEFTDKK